MLEEPLPGGGEEQNRPDPFHGRQRVEQVELRVWTENPAAIALYKSAGFVVTGQDPGSLKVDGVSIGFCTAYRSPCEA